MLFPTEDCRNVQRVASQGTAGWQAGKYQVLTVSGALGDIPEPAVVSAVEEGREG